MENTGKAIEFKCWTNVEGCNSKNRALNTDHQSEVQTPPGSSVFALAKAGRLPGREREAHTHPSRWVA